MPFSFTALAASLFFLITVVSATFDMAPPHHGLYRKRQAGNTCLPNYMTLDQNDASAWCPKDQGTLVSATLPNPTAITAYFIPKDDPTATATMTVIPTKGATVWFCHCKSTATGGAGQTGTGGVALPANTGNIVNNSKKRGWDVNPEMLGH